MLTLNSLTPSEGARKEKKRVGRGPGSGSGKTAARGHKGARARSGYSASPGFEGGQMPLQRVVPKSGFKNINKVEYKGINLEELQQLAEKRNTTVIDREFLVSAGVAKRKDRIKILGGGNLSLKLEVKAHAFSKSAKEAIEKVQGTTEIL